ncbi:MAG: NAD(P)-binding protein [Aeromicrobium sp.]
MSEHPADEFFDVCIVGAGIAGLNAAFVASQYLPPDATILILDKHDQPGGMWNDAYSYVRLHQPYQIFTAGNIKWTLGREPGYLASRDEVVEHLRHCFDEIASRVSLEARWGWTYDSFEETSSGVAVAAADPGGQSHRIRADRLINAIGFDIEVSQALRFSASNVRSISPQQVAEVGLLTAADDAPAWVVGSGKTAMDTINAMVAGNPGREIGMITGAGTYFINRDKIYVSGVRRWLGGARPNSVFAETANRFDGSNGASVGDWFRTTFGVTPIPDAPHNFFGALSMAESANVLTATRHVVRDHLVDIVDEDGVPALALRSGDRRAIAAGSWIVNCTGHFTPRVVDHDPYVSAGGRALSINSSSMTLGFSSFSAYYLSHLFFLGKLSTAPLYELDFHAARKLAAADAPAVLSALIIHNLSVVFENVPQKVFQNCGLDFDLWYPAPRRLAGQLKFLRTHKRDRERHRQTLDAYATRTGVRCAQLEVPPITVAS